MSNEVKKKGLATVSTVSSMMKSQCVLVEINGAIKRITLDNLITSINDGDTQMLRSVAWGVPIKQTQSSPDWGRVGNTDLWEAYKSQCGCYLLTNDGKAAKLSVTNRGVYADGTTLDETKGNIVWIGPRLYYRVEVDAVTNIPYLWMSEMPISNHYIGSADHGNYNVIGCYLGSFDANNKLRSVSGATVKASITINAFWNAAQLNGQDFGLVDYDLRKLMIMMNLAEYGNPNVQENIGYGPCGDGNTWANVNAMLTGATKPLGDQCGVVDISSAAGNNKACHVSFFGIENPYGWYWEMMQGIYFGNSGNAGQTGKEVFLYKGNHLPSAAELSTVPNGDFRQLERITGEGWLSEIILGEHFDFICKSTSGGNSNARWCDYAYYGNTTGQLGLVGARASHGSRSGLAYVYSNHGWSHTEASVGSRLAYYGKLEFVDGREIA